jgi:hypothetical protein
VLVLNVAGMNQIFAERKRDMVEKLINLASSAIIQHGLGVRCAFLLASTLINLDLFEIYCLSDAQSTVEYA